MTDRTTAVLITALNTLSLSACALWLTSSLKSVSLRAIGASLFAWALVGHFE